MKIALCFIISYDHILNKEEIWKEWIEKNKDIINVYFYYKNYKQIKSEWIKKHSIPYNYIFDTSYYHVIPAYISLMNFALTHDNNNQWFCMLTESCCPIISPTRFRYLFYNYYNKSIVSWKKSWWNIQFHKRANLEHLPEELHLANDPWFVLKRENVLQCLQFLTYKKNIFDLICQGGLANESLFAIILYSYKELKNNLSSVTHMTDWNRMTNATSPHLFKEGNMEDQKFIEKNLIDQPHVMFIRKISPDFPNDLLNHYIYDFSKEKDKRLILKNPFIIKKIGKYMFLLFYYTCPMLFLYLFYFHFLS
jgi:hypothetical protein